MNDLSLIIALLLLSCLALLVLLLIRQNASLHAQEEGRLRQEQGLENLGNQLLDELDAQRDQTMDSLYQGNQHLMTTLSQISQGQSNLLENMLASVYKGLGEMQGVATGVGDLKKVMTNVKTRGIWGEMQLGSLIRQSLAPGQYEENVAVVPGSAERVEFAVCLPDRSGGKVYLPIDSKFPQEDFLRLTDAARDGNAAAAEAARKALLQRLKSEAKKIAEKYISPPDTTDFAIMFLPVEGLYAEALQTPELAETLQRDYRVVIAGPGTFSAMLSALNLGFRTLTLQERSAEVWHLLGRVETEFAKFSDSLDTARRHLNQAEDALDDAASKARNIQRQLKDVATASYIPNETPDHESDHLFL